MELKRHTFFIMKKFLTLLALTFILTSCVANKVSIKDYSERTRLMRLNFPELYELYCKGQIIVDDVYTYTKDGEEKVHISYRYR